MAYFRIPWNHPLPKALKGCAVSVGNFDGVHRGHQQLIQATRRWADHFSCPCVAVTFDPPPMALLQPDASIRPLTTLPERAHLLEEAGASDVVALQIDTELLALTPRQFFDRVILGLFQARAMVEGYNFHFGRNRAGDTQVLRAFCQDAGLQFEEVAPFSLNGAVVSSSRVRGLLQQGKLADANELLGRAYSLRGTVTTGARRGRTIGFPTANITGVVTLIPAEGVYAVRVHVGENCFAGAANIGPNPTFGEVERKFEVHLLDFRGDLYGQELHVEFLQHLRGTRPFASVESLIEQLQADVEAARRIVSPLRHPREQSS